MFGEGDDDDDFVLETDSKPLGGLGGGLKLK